MTGIPDDAVFQWNEHPDIHKIVAGGPHLFVKFQFAEGPDTRAAHERPGKYRVYVAHPQLGKVNLLQIYVDTAGSEKGRKKARVFLRSIVVARFQLFY